MSKGLRVLAIAAMVLAVMCGAAFASDWGAFNSLYLGIYSQSRLVGGKTTPESYTNSSITADWDFVTSTNGNVESFSQTLTFNDATDVHFQGYNEAPVISVNKGETRTFEWKDIGPGSDFYANSYELYNDYTADAAKQKAISSVPFTLNIDGVTITGQTGHTYSVREMIDSKCVPMIEPIWENDKITSVKWAFVRTTNFDTPVKRSATNDVATLRLFEFRERGREQDKYPRYRCYVNKNFADGEELSGEMVVANATNIQMRKSEGSPWEPFDGQSIPIDVSTCEVRIWYTYDDGDFSCQNGSGETRDYRTTYVWCFTDKKYAPEVPVEQGNVHPTFTDTAIKSADCTGTNAEVPGDLEDAKIAPSKPGETNAVKNVVATVTIKVTYNDETKVGSNSEITVKIDGDYSSLAGRLSNLFALIQNNDDKKYHKFPILSADKTGLRFKLPVKGFFSEKVITIAELETTEQKTSSSSSSCAAGALAPLALAALAVIGRKKR